jgi:predicted acyltransferase
MDSLHISTTNFGTINIQEYVYSRIFAPLLSPANASLLYALAYVGLCWLAMALLYRKGWFLKI